MNSAPGAIPLPEIFGVPLKRATREAVRAARSARAVTALREDDAYPADIYDGNGDFPGVDQLEMLYVGSGRFAAARYRFAGADALRPRSVGELVVPRYGNPTRSMDNPRHGFSILVWERPDGLRIELARVLPDPSTYLVLVDQTTWPQAIEEMARHARTRAVAAHALEVARAQAVRARP